MTEKVIYACECNSSPTRWSKTVGCPRCGAAINEYVPKLPLETDLQVKAERELAAVQNDLSRAHSVLRTIVVDCQHNRIGTVNDELPFDRHIENLAMRGLPDGLK